MAQDESNKEVDIADLAADMYHAVVTNAAIQSGVDHRELPYWHELADSDRTFIRNQAQNFVQAIRDRDSYEGCRICNRTDSHAHSVF